MQPWVTVLPEDVQNCVHLFQYQLEAAEMWTAIIEERLQQGHVVYWSILQGQQDCYQDFHKVVQVTNGYCYFPVFCQLLKTNKFM